MTQKFIFDMIHENPMKYSGVKKDWKHTDQGKKPVIKPKTTSVSEILLPWKWNDTVYPYELQDKNFKHVSGVGEVEMIVLIPTPDIPNYTDRDYRNSFYVSKMNQDESKRVQKLREELDEKEEELKTLRRDLDAAKAEEEESTDSQGSGPLMLECNFCSKSSRKSAWEDEEKEGEEFCPKCGQGTMSNAKQVN